MINVFESILVNDYEAEDVLIGTFASYKEAKRFVRNETREIWSNHLLFNREKEERRVNPAINYVVTDIVVAGGINEGGREFSIVEAGFLP